jgi:putative endonuclease
MKLFSFRFQPLSFRPKGGIRFLPREKKYYVYIMASKGRVLYVGVTGSLMRRVLQHKSGEDDGFTKRYHITRLVYYQAFRYVNNAIARETEIKKWRRAKKVALIEASNPAWGDLAEGWGKPADMGKADSSLRSE